MKTLVIVAHPNLNKSKVNKIFIEELEKNNDQFTVHKLYEVYPDEKIDVNKEHDLILSHDNIVLQFPIYWFNCPPLMKKWLDEVLTYGWAYGENGDNFKGRKLALAVSLGSNTKNYSPDNENSYSLEKILLPFEMTANYISAKYSGFTAVFGTEKGITKEEIEQAKKDYIKFMKEI